MESIPFHYGTECACIYHTDCLSDLTSCIYHQNSKILTTSVDECILSHCSQRTSDVVCSHSITEIEVRVGKILANNGNCIEVSDLFTAVFGIKSMWTTSITASVSKGGVDSDGMFKQRQHPTVFTAWPVIWRHLRASSNFIVEFGMVWVTWKWIEHNLQDILPRLIRYTEITGLIPGITDRHVISFRTAINLGRTEVFRGVDSSSIRKTTPLNCYSSRRLLEALRMADHAGIPIATLMQEDDRMSSFIDELVGRGEVLVANRRVYARSMLEKATGYDERFAPLWK